MVVVADCPAPGVADVSGSADVEGGAAGWGAEIEVTGSVGFVAKGADGNAASATTNQPRSPNRTTASAAAVHLRRQ